MRRSCTYFGNPWIGMFVKSSDSVTLVPVDSPGKLLDAVRSNLKTEVSMVSLGDSNLMGLYIAMNSNGAVLPNITSAEEAAALRRLGLNTYVSEEKSNAHGNNISVNDKGGIINPHIPVEERRRMEDALGVELVPMHVAKYATVGSSCLAGNRGFLMHYGATEDELRSAEEALRVKGARGTVNMGTGFVSFGIVANRAGYIAGEGTSAHELGRAESALGYI